MGFIISAPTYIYQSPSGYIFRLRVPQDLRAIVGKVEFRYSLRSGLLSVAKQRARSIAAFIQRLFSKVRTKMEDFTSERISEIVRNYIRETLANDEKCRAMPRNPAGQTQTLEGKTFLEASDMKSNEANSMLTVVNRWLQNQDHTVTEPLAKRFAGDLSADSPEFSTLSREMLKAFQSILHVRIKRSEGDYSQTDEELIPDLKRTTVPVQVPDVQKVENPEPVVKFSEIKERFVTESERGDNWTEKTKKEYVALFELFVRIVGDLDVKQIDRKKMSEFKEILLQLPPNLNKSPQYRDKSIDEILKMDNVKPRAPRTVNAALVRIGSLFNYAVKNGYMLSNPATDLKVKIKTRPDEERSPFTKEDLIKLFHSPDYVNGAHKHPYRFWIPLIALYTGCRIEEICQLHLEDIRHEQGIWVFDINAKKEKRLKNMASVRLVPIHQHLIDRGLLTYADELRGREGVERLFPELNKRQQDKYSHYPSRWFATYRAKCGVAKGKTFHSFRHTFITHLKHKQVDMVMLQELDGHSVTGETAGRYGKRYTPEILLKEAIEKIDYEISP